MERAGYRLFRELHEKYIPVKGQIWVFCGIGNNGGDGLVIARHLQEARQDVKVIVVNFSKKRAPDMLANLHKVKALGVPVKEVETSAEVPEITGDDLVVDAVFGIGLNRKPPRWVGDMIQKINHSGAKVVAVDIPSGLTMEGLPGSEEEVIQAHHTYTFELPKLPMLLPETGKYSGNWSLISIDQDPEFIRSEPTPYYFTTQTEAARILQPRNRFSHKGNYGHVLVVGGSYGKIGAPLMSAEASITSGSGLVSALVPSCGYEALQTAVPEVMCLPSRDERTITDIDPDFAPDVVALGPGLGTEKKTALAIMNFMDKFEGGLVLDADGLNILAAHPEMWEKLPSQTIITPHPGEFRRLVGDWDDDYQRLEMAMSLAASRKVVVVLKGAYTLITDGHTVHFNSTGNPGMATGGSGDVLTGIIASLLGQGYSALDSAKLGVYLHGLSGDIAVRDTSVWALKATDIIDYLGDAYLFLESSKR